MKKNKRLIIIIAIAVVVIASVFIIAPKSGSGISGWFSGKDSVQAAVKQENTVENTKTDNNIVNNEIVETMSNQDSESPDEPATSGEQQETTQENPESIKEVEKIKVKAIYLSGTSAGTSNILDRYINLVNSTELNAIVIDVKESGRVNYLSSVPTVAENGLYNKYYDVDKVIKKLHDNNIYVIGRVVCFRDDGLASKRADLAIKRVNGTIWKEGAQGAWTNPYMEEVWRYNIDIAKEAASRGFDEIQFDYVRFPTAKKSEVNYGSNVPSKVETICSFLKMAKEELHDGMDVPVSADVFGIIAESKSDGEAIGQDIEKVGLDIDSICPMIYPSHYANAGKGVMGNGVGQDINGVKFTAPDLKPYEVVYNTLLRVKERTSGIQGYNAVIRPYLQDFTATYIKNKLYYQEYGVDQVRQQIKAVYDAGYEEWIFWDGRNTYTEAAFEKIQ